MYSSGKKRSKGSKGKPAKSKKKQKVIQSDDESPAFLSSKYAEPPASKIYNSRFKKHTPAELFRKDLISAMKLPDNEPLAPGDYWQIEDSWKPEWEKGVQVPVEPDALLEPNAIEIRKRNKDSHFKLPKKLIRMTKDNNYDPEVHLLSYTYAVAERTCRYDLDDVDVQWLTMVNEDRDDFGLQPIDEETLEILIQELEDMCHENFQDALRNDGGSGIDSDEDAICDVCRSPDSEDGNEIVFCDSCNMCVHQSCYGITRIPEGSWICRTCALGLRPSCMLCPNRGGAMKPTRSGEKWCHVSCAIWLPEVSISCVEKMEPITKISQIPLFRWSLLCVLCQEKVGACIQCSAKSCKVAYHVTCAFKARLRMRAIMSDDEDDDALKLKSYCPKHTKENNTFLSDSDSEEMNKKEIEMTSEEKYNAREEKLQEREANFFRYVNIDEIASICNCDKDVIESVFNYWKLKRKANFNRALLRPREVHVDDSSMEENYTYNLVKRLVLLRRDLERARNLCYMTNKREKLTKSWVNAKHDIFMKQVQILSDDSVSLSKEDREAVLMANYGDLAHDKKYTGADGPPPNTLKVLNTLIGEENTKAQLNGILKMRKKNDSSPLKKTPNPYAKHYLNGLLKRSQRWLATVDRQKWEDTCFPGISCQKAGSDGRERHSSFTSTSEHVMSDDGMEIGRDAGTYNLSSCHVEKSMNQGQCSSVENAVADASCISNCIMNTHATALECMNNSDVNDSVLCSEEKLSVTSDEKPLGIDSETEFTKPGAQQKPKFRSRSFIPTQPSKLKVSNSETSPERYKRGTKAKMRKSKLTSSVKFNIQEESEDRIQRRRKMKHSVALPDVSKALIPEDGNRSKDCAYKISKNSKVPCSSKLAKEISQNSSFENKKCKKQMHAAIPSSIMPENYIPTSIPLDSDTVAKNEVSAVCDVESQFCEDPESNMSSTGNYHFVGDEKLNSVSELITEISDLSGVVEEIELLRNELSLKEGSREDKSCNFVHKTSQELVEVQYIDSKEEMSTENCQLQMEPEQDDVQTDVVCNGEVGLVALEHDSFSLTPKSGLQSSSSHDEPISHQMLSQMDVVEVGTVIESNKALYSYMQGSPSSVNTHQNSSFIESDLSKSVVLKAEDPVLPSGKSADICEKTQKSEQKSSLNAKLPRMGSLTGYKIPKKIKTSVIEESSLGHKRGNSPLSPLTDLPASSASSSSYVTVSRYQRPRLFEKRHVHPSSNSHMNHKPSPPPLHQVHLGNRHGVPAEVQFQGLANQTKNGLPTPPRQWRPTYSSERMEVPGVNWRPMQYQSAPSYFHGPSNTSSRHWRTVRSPCQRRPVRMAFGPGPHI